jgi:hypothetical protein
MAYGDPRLRRARPRHGFTSPGYVENLPQREIPPTNWKRMREEYIPQGIMNFIALQFGPKFGAGVGLSTLMEISRRIKGGQQRGYRREFNPPW